jgi:hypothetical protein
MAKFSRFQTLLIGLAGNQEYKKLLRFSFQLSYLGLSQIWLNYFLNDCHIDYITKSLKQTLL